ncbi:MAG: DUF3999 domain-containing protein [Proteobacteria bacterium]|nr:DUF3999 domain-containing protein [Pseudomonadota bacterium]
MKPLLTLAALVAAAAQAGEAPLQLSGSGPYHQLTLPIGIHALAADAALADLRLVQPPGQPLAWAWADDPPPTPPAEHRRAAAIYPLPAGVPPQARPQGLTLTPDGRLVLTAPAPAPTASSDWIVDAGTEPGSLTQLRLHLTTDTQGVYTLRLAVSDDLQHWRPLDDARTVMQLAAAGSSPLLRQDAVALDGVQARFLRLHWLGRAPRVEGAEVVALATALAPPPALQWTADAAPTQCDERGCDWPLPPGTPLDALRLTLAQPNTVVALRLLADLPVAHRHAQRRPPHPLHAWQVLRQRPATAGAAAQPPRRMLADAVAWRLTLPTQGDVSSPPLWLDGSVATRLRIEPQGGPGAWGNAPPRVALGVRPRQLVVLVREPKAPVLLRWGDGRAPGAAVAAATLRPATAAAAGLGSASVVLPPLTLAPAASAPAPAPDRPAARTASGWLWAALGLGLVALAGMAFSLLRQLRRPH